MAFLRLLEEYGEEVTLRPKEGAAVVTRAFVRPVLAGEQEGWGSVPTPLGVQRTDRYRYLGRPSDNLSGLERGGTVEWRGGFYTVRRAWLVPGGKENSHWQGELRPALGEETA